MAPGCPQPGTGCHKAMGLASCRRKRMQTKATRPTLVQMGHSVTGVCWGCASSSSRSLSDSACSPWPDVHASQGKGATLVPVSHNRLLSLLCRSQSTESDQAEPTRLQRTILFLVMGGFLECNLRACQRGNDLPTQIIDLVDEEYSLCTFVSADYTKESIKAERREALRCCVARPTFGSFIAYTHPGTVDAEDLAVLEKVDERCL